MAEAKLEAISESQEIFLDPKIAETETLYKLFKRTKMVSKNILRNLKKMNLDNEENNQRSVSHHFKVFKFLTENLGHNLFLRTRPFYKKFSYLIHALQQIDEKINDTQVVIVACSLELCKEIHDIACALAEKSEITIQLDVKTKPAKAIMNSHLHITTIGSLLHNLRTKKLFFNKLKLIIFEEFDNINFSRESFRIDDQDNGTAIKKLLDYSSGNRSIFLSSSLDDEFFNTAKALMDNNLRFLDLLKPNDFFNNLLHFYVEFQKKEDKLEKLIKVLENSIESEKKIIFVVGRFGHVLKGKKLHFSFEPKF